MSLRVQCPTCGKTLGVPESAAGREGKCNACGSKLFVPKVAAPVALEPPMAPPPAAERRCPFCSEAIQATASKCRWCGEYLDPDLRRQVVADQIETVRAIRPKPGAFSMLLSMLLPGLGQWYTGRPLRGVCWFIGVAVGYAFLVLPGVVLHAACVGDAGGWTAVRAADP